MPIIRSSPGAANDGSTMPMERVKNVNDILDWLSLVFGFQVMDIVFSSFLLSFDWKLFWLQM